MHGGEKTISLSRLSTTVKCFLFSPLCASFTLLVSLSLSLSLSLYLQIHTRQDDLLLMSCDPLSLFSFLFFCHPPLIPIPLDDVILSFSMEHSCFFFFFFSFFSFFFLPTRMRTWKVKRQKRGKKEKRRRESIFTTISLLCLTFTNSLSFSLFLLYEFQVHFY